LIKKDLKIVFFAFLKDIPKTKKTLFKERFFNTVKLLPN